MMQILTRHVDVISLL